MFTIEIPAWMDRAACLGHEPDMWFPDSLNHGADIAKAICKLCPVAHECLDYAMQSGVIGIWAATTEGERKRKRVRAA